MDEQNQQNAIAAFFPAPPPFYKHFNKENTARIKAVQDAATAAKSSNTNEADSHVAENEEGLPPELQFLVPPKPPQSGVFRCFGETIDINNPLRSLRDQGIEQVYPSPPSTPSGMDSAEQAAHRAKYLSTIAKSILLSYLELVGALSVNPAQWTKKAEDLQVLFYNAHHLINEYRAHHSRHMLIEMMEEQLEQKRGEIRGMDAMKGRVEAILAKIGTAQLAAANSERAEDEDAAARQTDARNQQRIWDALNKI